MCTKRIRRLAAGAGLLAVAWAAGAESGARDPLPAAVGKGLVEKDIAFLQKKLEKHPEKREVRTLKATAMLVALYAQDTRDAALRDQALKVAEALAGKDFAGAKAAAAGLKPGAAGPIVPVKLHEQARFDLEELMSVHRNRTVGGRNMEKDLRAQAKSVTDPALVAELAARLLLVSEYAAKMPPAGVAANPLKCRKWNELAGEEARLAREILAESAKGAGADRAALSRQLRALDRNCTACHGL